MTAMCVDAPNCPT